MRKIYSWLAAGCMLAGVFAGASAEEIVTAEDIAALQAEIDALRMEITQAESDLKAIERQYAWENRDRDIVFEQESYVLPAGTLLKLQPVVTPIKDTAPAETKLVWSTSDAGIARVDGLGRVTGVKAGMAEITCTATDNEQIYMSVQVQVVQPVKKIETEESIVTLVMNRYMNEERQISATVLPENAYDPSLTWTVEDESVVTVEDGLLKAVGVGSVRVTIAANDGSGVKKFIRVHVKQGVESISMSTATQWRPLVNGESWQLYADVGPKNAANKELLWVSDDESVATVTQSGFVRSVGPGTCRIYAKSTDGTDISSCINVEVIQPVKRISADTAVIYLKQDETAQPVFTVSPEKVTDSTLAFVSDNPAVATVDENGVIYPVDGGSCNITAVASDGYGAKCVVTVHVEPDIPLEMTGVDVHYTATGTPLVTPEVRNCSFDTDIVGFTFAVRCSDAYGNVLVLKEGDGSFTWKEAVLAPAQEWENAEWGGSLAGCEMVWKVEAWITGVTTADGDVITVTDDERTVFSWEKY